MTILSGLCCAISNALETKIPTLEDLAKLNETITPAEAGVQKIQ